MNSLRTQRLAASFSTIAFSAVQISLIALYPLIADHTELPLSQVILCFSSGSLLFLWASPFWGKFSDRNGRKLALLVGVAGLLVSLGAITYLVRTSADSFSFAILMASRVLYGLTASAIIPVAQAIQCGTEQSARHRALSRHSMNLAIGRVAGLLAFVFFSEWSIQVLATTCAVIAIGFGLVTQIEFSGGSAIPERSAAPTIFDRSTWLAPAFVTVFMFATSVELLNSLFSKTVRDRFSLDAASATRDTAMLLLLSAVVILLTQVAFRKYAKKLDTLTMARHGLKFGSLSLGFGICGFIWANHRIEFWSALTLISMGIGTIPPAYLALITNRDPSAQTAGRVSAVQTLGYFFGGLMASLTLQFRPDAPLAALLMVAAVLVSQVWIFNPSRKAHSL